VESSSETVTNKIVPMNNDSLYEIDDYLADLLTQPNLTKENDEFLQGKIEEP
jgi:hypothetical protein